MPGRRWLGCASAALMLVLAGCWTDGSSLQQHWVQMQRFQTLPGAPVDVMMSAQSTLSGMGLMVHSRRENDAYRLDSTTLSGKRFSLRLTADTSGRAPQTVVRLEWEKDTDEAFREQLENALLKAFPTEAQGKSP